MFFDGRPFAAGPFTVGHDVALVELGSVLLLLLLSC